MKSINNIKIMYLSQDKQHKQKSKTELIYYPNMYIF